MSLLVGFRFYTHLFFLIVFSMNSLQIDKICLRLSFKDLFATGRIFFI
jgi:hypothetical protein